MCCELTNEKVKTYKIRFFAERWRQFYLLDTLTRDVENSMLSLCNELGIKDLKYLKVKPAFRKEFLDLFLTVSCCGVKGKIIFSATSETYKQFYTQFKNREDLKNLCLFRWYSSCKP